MSIATAPPPSPPVLRLEEPPEEPELRIRPRRSGPDDVVGLVGAAVAAFSLVWLVFEWLTPMSGGFGFWLCWYVAFLGLYATVTYQRRGRMVAVDRIWTVVLTTAALCLFVPMVFIVGYTIYKGYHALRPTFFTQDLRYTSSLNKATDGGGKHAIIGTLEQVGLATLISVPLGVATAVFLSEIGGRLARPVRLVVDTMTAIPTIVAGLFVFATVVLTLGQSGFAGALALSVLMLPTVTKTAELVLKLVPGGLREASLALGGSQWRTTKDVVLPTARSGLVTSVILGIARAIGETAPLLLTIGGAFIV
ncbi:MAG: phosphate ABC transporter permease PstA, partial [Acidimicrobiia bacterium]|nr:phosphate ABC transporter permease PstA [Acidimicrobiia bacterium]